MPAADGTIERPGDTVPLAETGAGRVAVVRISDSDPACLDRLGVRGIRPGAIIVVAPDPGPPHDRRTIAPDGTALDRTDIDAIWVRPQR
ncbi:MAG: ferrous iron transport protein A [Micrococcales bacterium]|nr:ferrous iron transport protein A [Micrococcales bacterium]